MLHSDIQLILGLGSSSLSFSGSLLSLGDLELSNLKVHFVLGLSHLGFSLGLLFLLGLSGIGFSGLLGGSLGISNTLSSFFSWVGWSSGWGLSWSGINSWLFSNLSEVTVWLMVMVMSVSRGKSEKSCCRKDVW